jgi:fused signal recognition particle receptor
MGLFDLFKRKPFHSVEPPDASASQPSAADEHLAAASTPASEPGKLRRALNRTRAFLSAAFSSDPSLLADEAYWEELHEGLVLADSGTALAAELVAGIRREMSNRGLVRRVDVPAVAAELIAALLRQVRPAPQLPPDRLAVIMLVGVNGTGKTTLSAKLAHRLTLSGRRVLLAAADTFRAAATEQLRIWAGRIGADIVAGEAGADPSSVVFDAVKAALARDIEVLIVDTAGRLQTKQNLMAELSKTTRTVEKALDGVPASIARILVLDGTVGQNALSQAEMFNECCVLDGLAMTKLDGTARGGAILAVVRKLRLPVLYLGVGEGVEDIEDFDAREFALSLVSPA